MTATTGSTIDSCLRETAPVVPFWRTPTLRFLDHSLVLRSLVLPQSVRLSHPRRHLLWLSAPSRRVARQQQHSRFYREMRSHQARARSQSTLDTKRETLRDPHQISSGEMSRRDPTSSGSTGEIGNSHDPGPPFATPVSIWATPSKVELKREEQ